VRRSADPWPERPGAESGERSGILGAEGVEIRPDVTYPLILYGLGLPWTAVA
jgi:hypothetical protein